MTQPTTTTAGYEAAQTAAAYYRVPDAGYLRISGEDRIDFIQRQTTNDATTVTADHAPLTVLTSGTARIFDVWRLLGESEAIGVITLPGRAAATAQYLQGRIFFMDKVAVTDASAEVAQIALIGPDVPRVLAALGVDAAPAAGAVVAGERDGVPLRAVGMQGLIAQGVRLFVAAEHAEDVIAALDAAGAAALSPEAYAVLRVEAGLPGPARELTSDFTPLEANLDDAINGAKGCYAGQEVIARQITYGKIAKRLVGLRLEAPVPVGARVEVDGRRTGEITSVAESPRLGVLALGVLRSAYREPGQAVNVVTESGATVAGETAALPFGAA